MKNTLGKRILRTAVFELCQYMDTKKTTAQEFANIFAALQATILYAEK